MKLISFFKEYPSHRQEIFSYLMSTDVIVLWQTNKVLQPLIEEVMFSQDHFYPVQLHVLSTLSRMKTSVMIDQRLHHLAQVFLSKLTNIDLTLSEVLLGLEHLAAIYQVPLDITPIIQQLEGNQNQALACLTTIAPALTPKISESLVLPLIAKLYDKNNQDRQAVFTCLTAIVPKLETTTLVRLVHFVLGLSWDLWYLHERLPPYTSITSTFLTAIVLRLNMTTLAKLTPYILVRLNDNDHLLLQLSSTFLTVMIPKLDDTNLTKLIDFILAKLNDSRKEIVQAAVTCLIAMIPRLDDTNFSRVTQSVFMKLEGHHKMDYIFEQVIRCLTAIVPKLNDKTLALWAEPILVKLDYSFNNKEYRSDKAALDCLTAMALRLEDIKLLSCLIQSIFIKPNHHNPNYISERAILKCLTAMVPQLDAETLVLWINSILAKLDDWNSDVCEAASTCLVAMLSRLDDANLTRLIDPILAKLNDAHYYVYSVALRHLTAIVPILDITTVVSLIDSILAKLDQDNHFVYHAALRYLTVMVPIVDTITVVSWVDSILAKTRNGLPYIREAALICLTAMVPKLNSITLMSSLQFILENLNKNFYPYDGASLMTLLKAIVSRLSQLDANLSADLIALLAPILSHNHHKIAQLCFKLSIHLSVYCHEKLSVNNADKLLQIVKNNELSIVNVPTNSFLLDQVVYPWLAQIVTSSQQPIAELTKTDKTNLLTGRQPDSGDADAQLVSPQQAQVIQRLTTYIARINSFEDGFEHGFWVAQASRAINREINVMLADELISHLKNKTKTITDLFSNDSVSTLRQQLIKNYAFDKRAGYVERSIGSRELNHIIRDVQNIERESVQSFGCCGW